jgi:AraC-like DNA-binding protein
LIAYALAQASTIGPPPGRKLRRFSVVDTTSRDEMRDALVNRYSARDFDARRRSEPFCGFVSYLPLTSLDLSYGSISTDVNFVLPAADFVRQQFVLSGSGRIAIGRSRLNVRTDETSIIPAGAEFGCDFSEGFSHLFLRIKTAALRSKLSALIGKPVGRTMQFVTPFAVPTPEQSRLRRLIDFFVSEVDRADANFSDLVLADFEQTLILAFLAANTHDFSSLLQGRLPAPAPWQVKVVEAYLEANWSRPITIEAIAEATGVGVRSMFQTFKDARGYSPMTFLQRIRLEHAKRMLEAPDETTTVTAVGFFCGFHNAGHFARYYRDTHGELPSTTLTRAKAALC